jgi:hypothetical protein
MALRHDSRTMEGGLVSRNMYDNYGRLAESTGHRAVAASALGRRLGHHGM